MFILPIYFCIRNKTKKSMKQLMKIFATLLISVIITSATYADNGNTVAAEQKATIKGQVVDQNTGESLAGAMVQIQGTEIKTYTDLDGNFKFNSIDPGNYTIEISYISYNSENSNVILDAGMSSKIEISLQSK